jgi:adenylosuccinate synthase
MPTTVVVGMQWGDEAKGKIVDLLAQEHDYIVRFNGGDNAGHTIRHGEKTFKLHLVPSGVFYPEKTKVIANGVVVNLKTLLKELGEIETAGYSMKNLVLSESAHLIMPWHVALDGLEERKGGIGTTKKGIGPAYSDKAARVTAMRAADLLLDEKELRTKVMRIGTVKNSVIKALGGDALDIAKAADETVACAKAIRPYVADTRFLLNGALSKGRKVLLEGAQGGLLDVDHGTYPYVTSSNMTAGGACTGTGIPPSAIGNVVGVAKAYTTRVGAGPFPTELLDETGERIRQKGGEFGTTTGRPRRCGWLDMVVLHYCAMLNGTHELALIKLDVLDGMDELKVCVAYENEKGKHTTEFPADINALARMKPVYKTFRGWKGFDWKKAKAKTDLPKEMQEYLSFVEKELRIPIRYISYGPAREETLTVR